MDIKPQLNVQETLLVSFMSQPAIFMFKLNKRNIRLRCEIWRQRCCSGVFIDNFEHISHLVVVFLLFIFDQINADRGTI